MTLASPRKVWVWMDVSASCNLSCRDCYTKATHEPALLSPDRFGHVLTWLDQPGVEIQRLHLNWRGEPLINKRLPEMLHRKKKLLARTPLEFHTHGLLMTPSLAQEIIGLVSDEDRIYVSIDGGCPEVHEANRGEGTWDGALLGLRALLEARDRADRQGPILGIYEISYELPARAHPDLIALGRRCDEWTRVKPIGADGGEAAFLSDEKPAGPCFWAGHAICLTAKGDVHVCLLSFRPDGKLGNVFIDGLPTILDRAAAFRTRIQLCGRSAIAHCRSCRKTEGEIDQTEPAGA